MCPRISRKTYLGEFEKQCVAVPDPNGRRSAHREAEVAGPKEALSTLSEGEVLVQHKSHRTLLHQHAVA